MTHQPGRTGRRSSRSQSTPRNLNAGDTVREQRRKSVANVSPRPKPTTQTLQVQEPGASRRRYSSIRLEGSPVLGASPSCRSRSLKSPSQSRRADATGSNAAQGNAEARSFQYSLSVPGDENEFHRLRNFSITPKGIVNRGDSFRCKSPSTSRSSSPRSPPPPALEEELRIPEITVVQDDHACGSSSPVKVEEVSAVGSSPSPSRGTPASKYRVWIMGLAGVGKSSIKLQFMTSEYICEYDISKDENNKNVIIVLDGDEVELEITECTGFDDKAVAGLPMPDAFVVVYSVTNRRSYVHAKHILSDLEPMSGYKAVILVGNKTDLARLTTVTTVEGRSMAKEWCCKFIETSVTINHQVDELLVGIVTQVRIKAKLNEKRRKKQAARGVSEVPTTQRRKSKATGIIIRLWRKTCMTNKSCDNLHCV